MEVNVILRMSCICIEWLALACHTSHQSVTSCVGALQGFFLGSIEGIAYLIAVSAGMTQLYKIAKLET